MEKRNKSLRNVSSVSGGMGVFYLSKRRTLYFGDKSIVHICDASKWVGIHSVCIKRFWPSPISSPTSRSRRSQSAPFQLAILVICIEFRVPQRHSAGSVPCGWYLCSTAYVEVRVLYTYTANNPTWTSLDMYASRALHDLCT